MGKSGEVVVVVRGRREQWQQQQQLGRPSSLLPLGHIEDLVSGEVEGRWAMMGFVDVTATAAILNHLTLTQFARCSPLISSPFTE